MGRRVLADADHSPRRLVPDDGVGRGRGVDRLDAHQHVYFESLLRLPAGCGLVFPPVVLGRVEP